MKPETLTHTINPVYDKHSRILILGTFPSVKSREYGFFYGHPQNRFWKVLPAILNMPVPQTIAEKKELLLARHIALWDVLAACEITGAADSSIKNAVPNDFSRITKTAAIKQVFATGKTAQKLYQRFTGEPAVYLPSTSPANCRLSMEELLVAYSEILQYL